MCSTYRHVVADHDLQPAEDLEDAHAVRASAAHTPTIDRQIHSEQTKENRGKQQRVDASLGFLWFVPGLANCDRVSFVQYNNVVQIAAFLSDSHLVTICWQRDRLDSTAATASV